MKENDRTEKLGKVGQNYVARLFGHSLSKDKFDSKKDGHTQDSLTWEVKTEVPFVTTNEVSIRSHQLRKCLGVDLLYFVTCEPKGYPNYEHKHKVFLARKPSLLEYRLYTKPWGEMAGFKIDQDYLEQVNEITDDDVIYELRKYRTGGL